VQPTWKAEPPADAVETKPETGAPDSGTPDNGKSE